MTTILHILPFLLIILAVLIGAVIAAKLFWTFFGNMPALYRWQERQMRQCPALWNDEEDE